MNAQVTENIKTCIEQRDFRRLRDSLISAMPADIAEILSQFPASEQAVVFRILPRDLATEIFEYMPLEQQSHLLNALGDGRVAIILNEMAPDDRTALLEEIPAAAAKKLINLLSKEERSIALSLLGYPENSVGRLMTPEYLAVRQDWDVKQVLDHIRAHGHRVEHLHTLYVIDDKGKLVSYVRVREVLLAESSQLVRDIMEPQVVSLRADQDQEEAVETFRKYDRNTLPVVDSKGIMIGIVTVDDVLDIAEEEATEDIQKLGAVEALTEPYLSIGLGELIRKRVYWLIILFFGEMLTAGAMGFFEYELERAVVLAIFIPLIISSGGNSGSQAATLVIRSLAIGELHLRDWLRVFKRELCAGLALGGVLGAIGFLKVALLGKYTHAYGSHWLLLGATVSATILAVVLWGVTTGAMLPFILKRLGADPATSSTPFIATLVDVTGVVIYFSIASLLLSGTLL